MTLVNVFDRPMKYLDEIKSIRIPVSKRKRFLGKSYLCVWVTKFCPAKCSSCFFKSNMLKDRTLPERNQFSQYGLGRLIKFVNDSNNSYIQLSGGGEPMIRRDAVLEVIRRVKTDRIVIVTSGLFAISYDKTNAIITELYEAHQSRNDKTILVLRLSVDEFHQNSLGFDILVHTIRVYQDHFRSTPNFELRIHTMDGDPAVEKLAEILGDCTLERSEFELVSDNNEVIKIMPKQATLVFNDGYNIHIGIAKMFYSDLRMDLNTTTPTMQSALDVFDEDMSESEYGNPSTITNTMGPIGLDFWMDYNGNVTTWSNQQLDQLYNIYVDDYQDVVDGTYNNVLSYSFLEKGFYYRDRIIRTVNPKAALRSKVLNLRDYAPAFLLEEERTRLYYGIRVVKDYLEEGILEVQHLELLSSGLRELIQSEIEVINKKYHESPHDILSQQFKKTKFDKIEWLDLFSLISLGHFSVSDENLRKSLDYFNQMTGSEFHDINDIPYDTDEIQYGRLHNRMSFMKPEAERFCAEMQET